MIFVLPVPVAQMHRGMSREEFLKLEPETPVTYFAGSRYHLRIAQAKIARKSGPMGFVIDIIVEEVICDLSEKLRPSRHVFAGPDELRPRLSKESIAVLQEAEFLATV